MARTLTPKDAYALMNLVVKQATGQNAVAVVDSSTFVSAGETVLATGTENTLNALSIVLGRTLMAVRPYKAKLLIVQAINTGMYTSRLRKLSVYSQGNKPAGFVNTDLNPKNLYNGYENTSNTDAVGSQWEQQKPAVVQLAFGGQSVWQTQLTVYEDALKAAFRDEAEFMSLVNGIMTEKMNDIESTKEAFNRMNVLNFMAGVYDLNASGSVVDLTAIYNAKHGTSLTGAQIRAEHMDELLKIFVTEFKNASDFMTERSANFHVSPTKTIDGVTYTTLLRHTSKDRQKAVLYQPLFTEAKANVLPEIFNPEYLDISNYEGVSYWQGIQNRPAINVTPAIPDFTTGEQKAGDNVSLDYVVGMIFDTDAIVTDFQMESARATNIEARRGYRNTWWSFSKNAINDFTENAVLFVMS